MLEGDGLGTTEDFSDANPLATDGAVPGPDSTDSASNSHPSLNSSLPSRPLTPSEVARQASLLIASSNSHSTNPDRAEHALMATRFPSQTHMAPLTSPPPPKRTRLDGQRMGASIAHKISFYGPHKPQPTIRDAIMNPSFAKHDTHLGFTPHDSANRPEATILHPVIRNSDKFTHSCGRFYFHETEWDSRREKDPITKEWTTVWFLKLVRYEVFPRPAMWPPLREWEGKGPRMDGTGELGVGLAGGDMKMEYRKGLPERVVESLRAIEGLEEVERIVASAKGGRRYVNMKWAEEELGEDVKMAEAKEDQGGDVKMAVAGLEELDAVGNGEVGEERGSDESAEAGAQSVSADDNAVAAVNAGGMRSDGTVKKRVILKLGSGASKGR